MRPVPAGLLCGTALIAALAACSKGNENNASSSGSTTAAATPAPSAGPTTGAAGEVSPTPDVSSWNDNNIVANLAAGDKAEVKMGHLAESKATIPAVKDFAKMLVQDHTKGEKEVRDLETKAKLAAKPAPNDSGDKVADAEYKKLESMPKGKDWDSTFVKYEYDDHQHDIAATKSMQNQAKDSTLKQFLSNELPTLQKHEDAASKLLGNNGGSAAWKNADVQKTQPAKNTPNGQTKY